MVNPWIEIEDLADPDDPYAQDAIDTASFVLWSLSGRKYFGLNTITEQYVCSSYDVPLNCSWEPANNSFWNPSLGVQGYILPAHLYESSQSIGTRFRLRQTPVRQITSVTIGGEGIPSANYRVRNNAILTIAVGSCGSLCEGPIVTYKYGVAPPRAGKVAAIELANELIVSNGGGECSLPERVSSVQRQGMSFEMFDPQDFLDNGRTGVYKIDLFLAAANPTKSLKPAKVYSPDVPRGFTRK